MQSVRVLFLKWLTYPSYIELSFLYVLLGIYLVVATDSVIPSCWITFTIYSVIYIQIFMCFRLVNFIAIAIRMGLSRIFWPRWGQLIFIATIMMLLFLTNLGLCLRLKISENAMLKEVDKALAMGLRSHESLFATGPVPVGLFAIRIYKVDSLNRTVWLHTEDGASAFWIPSLMGGIVYCEQGHPTEISETNYQHLWGPWWRWAQDI